jgi:hypothetical protein
MHLSRQKSFEFVGKHGLKSNFGLLHKGIKTDAFVGVAAARDRFNNKNPNDGLRPDQTSLQKSTKLNPVFSGNTLVM